MESLGLVVRLLEKTSVLVAVVLVLVMLRPAAVWLQETGRHASIRRRIFLVLILSGFAIWGIFLGFSIGDQRFNVRMIGIITAGYLGGAAVGTPVGAAAGLVYAFAVEEPLGLYVFLASVIAGWSAGVWGNRFGTRILAVVTGAVVVQAVYHGALGILMVVMHPAMIADQAQNIGLHSAKIAANMIGVTLFMSLLNLVRELERVRQIAAESRDLVRTARLEALQYQVKPHFLFNLLNTLNYLIRTNPDKARELTLELSEFLRYTLSGDQKATSLDDELAQIARYVDLERARFGDGLTYTLTVDGADPTKLTVPPLLLQPLVENAIRHGSVDGKVHVQLLVQEDGEDIMIIVEDDGPGFEPYDLVDSSEEGPGGMGVKNVRERLERFYHGQATLTFSSANPHGTRAICRIPSGPKAIDKAAKKLEEILP